MLTSGVATRRTIDLNFEDEAESTVHVIIHDLKPPFLDGHIVFTKQLDPINPIRDPTSDMAVFAKKGCGSGRGNWWKFQDALRTYEIGECRECEKHAKWQGELLGFSRRTKNLCQQLEVNLLGCSLYRT
jgi:hypothetical protein